MQDLTPGLDPRDYGRFKWRTLADATYGHGLWEPLWSANVDFPDLTQEQREAVVVNVLLDLVNEDLIRFVRRPLIGQWPQVELAELGVVLDRHEIEETLQQTWWRAVPLERPPGDASI